MMRYPTGMVKNRSKNRACRKSSYQKSEAFLFLLSQADGFDIGGESQKHWTRKLTAKGDAKASARPAAPPSGSKIGVV